MRFFFTFAFFISALRTITPQNTLNQQKRKKSFKNADVIFLEDYCIIYLQARTQLTLTYQHSLFDRPCCIFATQIFRDSCQTLFNFPICEARLLSPTYVGKVFLPHCNVKILWLLFCHQKLPALAYVHPIFISLDTSRKQAKYLQFFPKTTARTVTREVEGKGNARTRECTLSCFPLSSKLTS